MRTAGPPTLSSRLLRHVLLPLALTWLAGTAVSAGIAYYFTQKAFDRSLLDDAALLATNVVLQGGELELTLTTREVNRVLFDQVETMYFSVRRPDGRVVAGVKDLQLEPVASPALHRFEDVELRGERLRAVTLHRTEPVPFDVVVAETTTGRNAVLQRLAWFSLLPQGLLLGVLALWLRRAIREDLQPLAQLQEALGRRSANDLASIHVEARTHDVATLAAALNALFARLEKSVRAQREFAGNVAHELRTPLAGIRALADYGLSQNDPVAWRDQLERIAASQARASRLVDQLLDLALALEAEAGLKLEAVDLDQLVRDAVLRFLPRADAEGVDLGAVGIDSPVRIRADATLVDGILTNLLDNALRYGQAADGQPSTVTVSIERDGGEVVLSVQDNGPGLPGEVQAQLVHRGAQGETGQLLGQGAGIGLALVSQYATLMNAEMSLGSGPDGQGWQGRIRFQAWA
ncbi:MAG: sensor histidine kinase [Comamonadaceae bacterium]|nr:MAG: sensor histidine kinase [Comamonadaceae bacterium]